MIDDRNPWLRAVALLAFVLSAVTLVFGGTAHAAEPEKSYVDQHYPDFGFLPSPSKYKGRIFTLSQKYPKVEPGLSERPEFLKIDFQANWREYLLAAQDYCFRDNILGGDVANEFVKANPSTADARFVPADHFQEMTPC